jgi:hypothetical protein
VVEHVKSALIPSTEKQMNFRNRITGLNDNDLFLLLMMYFTHFSSESQCKFAVSPALTAGKQQQPQEPPAYLHSCLSLQIFCVENYNSVL